MAIHSYRLAAIAPAVMRWLQRDFEFSIRPIDAIARDYAALAEGPRTLFIVNCLSTPRFESVQNYGLLDGDTLRRLTSWRTKELNLMLHDLERTAGIVVIDIDAIAANLGMLAHFPDDFHASGTLIDETRRELVHQLAAHRIAGFTRSSADQELGRHRLPAAD